MRGKVDSVINLDPISARNRKRKGIIGRLFITRRFSKGKKPRIIADGGHYLFVGPQRTGGKTTSMLWFYEYLFNKYSKRQKKKVIFYSNMGLGIPVTKRTFYPMLHKLQWDSETIHVFCIDELQSWFPKDCKDSETLKIIEDLVGEFSQLGKRNIYVLSTAQIYGRVNKNLREQCVYMVNCHISGFTHRCINDFINNDSVLCDDLGRWSGDPEFIYIHRLPQMSFDTHFLVSAEG